MIIIAQPSDLGERRVVGPWPTTERRERPVGGPWQPLGSP
jgi:hypothetical protein